jgi:hypothetical protein
MPQADPVRDILQSAPVEDSVKALVWENSRNPTDRGQYSQQLTSSGLPPATQQQLINLKFPGEKPTSPPGPSVPSILPSNLPQGKETQMPVRSAEQDFITGRPTGKEWAGMAVDALPAIGAGAAAALGPPGWLAGAGMAAAGGAVGQAVRHGIVAGVGPKNLSGDTVQVEPPPSSPTDFAVDIATEGGKQALYEMGGRALSGLIGGPLHAAGAKPENAVVKEVSKKYGLNLTAGQVTGSAVPKAIEKLGEYGLTSRGYINKKLVTAAQSGLSAINQVLGRLHVPTSPDLAGQEAIGMFKLSSDIFDQEATKMYSALDQSAHGLKVDMTSVKQAAQAELAKDAIAKKLHPNTGGFGPKTLKLLEDAAKQPDEISFNEAHDWRKNLRKATPQTDEARSAEYPAAAKRYVRDVTGAMEDSAKKLSPTAYQQWVDAREFYKKGAQLLDHEAITGLMEKNPSMVVHAIKPKIGDVDTVKRIRSAILDYPTQFPGYGHQQTADWTWRQFQEQFVRTHILDDPEATGQGFDVAKLAGIKERLHNMGPGVMKELMGGSKEGQAALDNLTSVGESFSRIDKLPNNEKMILYRAIETAMVATGAGILNHPTASYGTVAGLEILPMFVSAVVHSPKATAYMLDGLQGLTEAFKIKPTSLVGKASIKITGAANLKSGAYGKAMADIARAGKLVYDDRDRLQVLAEEDKKPGPPPNPPDKLDLLKDWQH